MVRVDGRLGRKKLEIQNIGIGVLGLEIFVTKRLVKLKIFNQLTTPIVKEVITPIVKEVIENLSELQKNNIRFSEIERIKCGFEYNFRDDFCSFPLS